MNTKLVELVEPVEPKNETVLLKAKKLIEFLCFFVFGRKEVSYLFSEKNAFITGGTSGIGLETARIMGKEHAGIYLVGRNENRLKEIEKEFTEACIPIKTRVCDIQNIEETKKAADDAIKTFGKIDMLINSAGIFKPTDICDSISDVWKQHFKINVDGTYNVVNAFLPYLKNNLKSSIVNLASVDAYQGCRGYVAYATTKGAVVSLTKQMALELAEYGIRVNAVAPGITDTNMTHDRIVENFDKYTEGLLIKRIGKPEDIANAIVFLASDKSDYITGEVIHVNGGMRLQ